MSTYIFYDISVKHLIYKSFCPVSIDMLDDLILHSSKLRSQIQGYKCFINT